MKMGKRTESLRFVRLVEKYPNIYVPSLRSKSKAAVRKSWSEIAKKSNATVLDCKEKWRKIRDALKKSLDRCNSGAPNKPYYLSEHLAFIIPYIKNYDNETQESFDETLEPMELEYDNLDNEIENVEIKQQEEHVQRKSSRSLKNTNRCTVDGCCVKNDCSSHIIKNDIKKMQMDKHVNESNTFKDNKNDNSVHEILPSLLEPVRSEIFNPEIKILNVQTKQEKDACEYSDDNYENLNSIISNNMGNNLNNDHNIESTKLEVDFVNNQNQIYQKPCCECIENNPRKMFLLSILPDIESLSESEMRTFRRDLIDSIDRIIYNRELINHN